jgi:hypothetical protein
MYNMYSDKKTILERLRHIENQLDSLVREVGMEEDRFGDIADPADIPNHRRKKQKPISIAGD